MIPDHNNYGGDTFRFARGSNSAMILWRVLYWMMSSSSGGTSLSTYCETTSGSRESGRPIPTAIRRKSCDQNDQITYYLRSQGPYTAPYSIMSPKSANTGEDYYFPIPSVRNFATPTGNSKSS